MTVKQSLLVTLALLVAAGFCQNNIDTSLPIVRTVSGLGPLDYFSYSIVLHQLTPSPSTREDALRNSRIVVSAPQHNIDTAAVEFTGAVWTCPVNNGTCEPLLGDGGGADNRLYDLGGNSNENKTNQFLGSSMASNGDHFIVCAHRHKVQISGIFYLRGRCYYSDRTLRDFTEHSPCQFYGSRSNQGSGVCQAGASVAVTNDGANGVFGFGAPGSFLWRGSVARLEEPSTRDNIPSAGQDAFGLLGYTIVAGFFTTTTRRDYAVSNPRFSQRSYLGRVILVANDETLSITNQPLNGQQMGEYYGFSLLAADLSGNSLDELIVGAPMYRANGTEPDAGRIYVYSNTNGALAQVRIIFGREAFSRFGYAMANLGDISGDGYDDIAVSAPFGQGTGAVYIYFSSATMTINPIPSQIITGESLTGLSPPPTGLKGFGTTLASGVDVDRNTYNDLAIGSFVSQQVYLLRTRPLAQVAVSISANPLIVNLDQMSTCPMLRGMSYVCFEVSSCVRYTGSGVSDNLDLMLTLFAERQNLQNNLEQRIFFDNGMAGQFPSMISDTVSATRDGSDVCFTTTAYVRDGIMDRFNGFIIEVVVTPPALSPPLTDGNSVPMDFSGFPVVSTTGSTMIQVETFKDCAGAVCIPDLSVSVNDVSYTGVSGQTPTQLTVGAVSRINTRLSIGNSQDDAFQATLAIRFRTNQLRVERVYNNTATGELTLSCTDSLQDESGVQYTTLSCSIGNPLNSDATLTINALFAPRPELVGNEGNVDIRFTVDSVNDENAGTEGDNSFTQQLAVNAMADVFLDTPGLVMPESLSYANFPPNGSIENVVQLGPSVVTSFVVRNSGPSSVPTVQLTINWPFDGPETGIYSFIYPASQTSESASTVMCSNTNINPSNYAIPDEVDSGEENQGVVTPGKRRRRKRSVPEVGRKVKRQADSGNPSDNSPTETDTTQERTFSCADQGPTLNCVEITCNILGLQGGSSAQVSIMGFIDERYFSSRNDRFTFIPTASVRIVDANYIISPNSQPTSSASIRVIPAGDINPDSQTPPFPWYAVVFPIIAVIIIIAVIAVILYFCGFFRRARHEEIKQKREELQNLADNGVTPDKDDGTNL